MSLILDNVLPVFVLIGLGVALLRLKLASQEFFSTCDRLIYYIFFPMLLFWKIGAAGSSLTLPPNLILAVLASIALVWLASLAYVRLTKVDAFQAGSFSQVTYRFNTYVGMAVVLGAFGEAGVARFGVIISLAIPFINVLAVGTLVWYSQAHFSGTQKLKMVVKAMLLNPLILSCLAGIAWAKLGLVFPFFVERSFSLGAALALPLALLSIGSSLSFGKLKGRTLLSLVACLFKLALLPLVAYAMLSLAGVEGLSMAVAMIFFALPTATSAYILSTQMNSDADLVGAAIVLSTLLSFISLSLVLMLFA